MPTTSPRSSPVPLTLLAALLAATSTAALPGQGRQVFENRSEGYRLSVSRAIKAVPTEPNERQALAKWGETLEFRDKLYRGKDDCSVMLVRIRKAKGPITGPDGGAGQPEPAPGKVGDKAADKPEQTVRERTIEQLNSGTTPTEFLQKRSFKSDLQPVAGERPIKSRDGATFVVNEIKGAAFDNRVYQVKELPIIRSYMLEDEQQYFGLIAVGPFVDPWRGIVEDMCKSLQRIELGASDAGGSGEQFSNADFREQVRKKLVKGWEAFDTEHYIFVTNSKNKTLIDQICGDLELMRQSYIQRFPPVEGVDLEGVISAVRFCSTYEDYLAYGGRDGTGGYWNFVDEELVLVDVQTLDFKQMKRNGMPDDKLENLKKIEVLDVLYHEAMHQYFFYANGNLAPASWFNEGFGEYFGGSVPDRRKNEIARVDKNKFRLYWIKQCQRLGRWPDLRAFLHMTQREFYGASSLQNYAFAWSFCYFLEQQRLDPKGNRAWAELPDRYLASLRAATKAKREELKIDAKDKQWVVAFQDELQLAAYEATFADIDLPAIEKAWIEAIKKWR